MEKYLINEISNILKKEKEIEDVETYINLEGSWVVSYKYNNEIYLISIDLL